MDGGIPKKEPERKTKVLDKALPYITFAIGLGIGEMVRRLALWLQQAHWTEVMFAVARVGVVAYMLWLGLKNWAEVTEIEELADELGGKGSRWTMYKLLSVFYWALAAITATVMF